MLVSRARNVSIAVAAALLLASPVRADFAVMRGDLAGIAVGVAELRSVELAQADPGRLADVELRLNQIEAELARVTGRLEEAEHRQRRQEERLELLVTDVDTRLRDLEDRGTAAAPATGPDPLPPGPTAAVPAPQPREAAPAPTLPAPGSPAPDQPSAGVQLAPGEQTLGSIPREALLGAPLPGDGQTSPAPTPGTTTPGTATASLGAQAQYDAALSRLRTGDYAGAEEAFSAFVAAHPDGALADNADYWIAETHYVRRDYQTAAAQFARNYSTYGPQGVKAPDNLLKLGMSLYALGDHERACQSYAELQRRHPNAPTPIQQAADRERARANCS